MRRSKWTDARTLGMLQEADGGGRSSGAPSGARQGGGPEGDAIASRPLVASGAGRVAGRAAPSYRWLPRRR